MKVHQAYRFALEPAPAQERMLRSHAGAARFAWNWGLSKCKERYEAEGTWYSGIDLHQLWNAGKKADPALAWWGENSKCAYQEAFRDLDRALRDFIKSRKGDRKGKRPGFPRFKKRGKCKDAPAIPGGNTRRQAEHGTRHLGRRQGPRLHPPGAVRRTGPAAGPARRRGCCPVLLPQRRHPRLHRRGVRLPRQPRGLHRRRRRGDRDQLRLSRQARRLRRQAQAAIHAA
jgi:hypothetical protein